MLRVLLVIAALIVVAAGVVVAVAAGKPDTFRVERSVAINAPPERIFPLINDFRSWRGWSPWENRDPALKRSYEGPERGKGAAYAWDGNNDVGSGRMEILDVAAPRKIVIKLDFLKPFEGHNIAEFTLLPQGSSTTVNWVMHGPAPFLSKLMQVFIDLDAMIGRDFEAGLANLKKAAES